MHDLRRRAFLDCAATSQYSDTLDGITSMRILTGAKMMDVRAASCLLLAARRPLTRHPQRQPHQTQHGAALRIIGGMDATCRFDGCTRPIAVRKIQLCTVHSRQFRSGYELKPIRDRVRFKAPDTLPELKHWMLEHAITDGQCKRWPHTVYVQFRKQPLQPHRAMMLAIEPPNGRVATKCKQHPDCVNPDHLGYRDKRPGFQNIVIGKTGQNTGPIAGRSVLPNQLDRITLPTYCPPAAADADDPAELDRRDRLLLGELLWQPTTAGKLHNQYGGKQLANTVYRLHRLQSRGLVTLKTNCEPSGTRCTITADGVAAVEHGDSAFEPAEIPALILDPPPVTGRPQQKLPSDA